MLYLKMRRFDTVDINKSTLHLVDDKMEIFKNAYGEFMLGIELLLMFFSDKLGADKVEHWRNVSSKTEDDFIEYKNRVNQKADAVKETLVPSFFPSMAQSQVASSMLKNEPLKDETLEKSQQEEEDEEQGKFNETEKENESKKTAAEAKAKKTEAIHADCDDPAEKTGFTDLEGGTLQSDLSIGQERKEIKTREDSLDKIVALKTNLDDTIANDDLNGNGVEYDVNITMETTIHDDDVNIAMEMTIHNDDVSNAVETTIHDVEFVEEAIRGDDDECELYTLDPAETHAIKILTFEGRDDEDFAKFQEDVEAAFVQTRVARF